MSRLRQLWVLIILVAITTAMLLVYNKKAQPIVSGEVMDDHYPLVFMTNVTAYIMNDDGQPESLIKSPRVTHYMYNNTTNFKTPNVVFYSEKGTPWRFTSTYGQAMAGTDELYFWDKVRLHQPTSKENVETTITSEAMTFYPKTEVVSTSLPVQLSQPNARASGVGMKAFMKTGTADILSHVKIWHQNNVKGGGNEIPSIFPSN